MKETGAVGIVEEEFSRRVLVEMVCYHKARGVSFPVINGEGYASRPR